MSFIKKLFLISLMLMFTNVYSVNAEELNGLIEKNGHKYYYENGEIQVGIKDVDGKKYFFSRDKTRYGVMRTGKLLIDGNYYVFDADLKTGLFEYDNNKYYANSEGIIQVGFQPVNDQTYFFSRDKKRYGVMRPGKFIIDGNYYVFDEGLKTGLFEYDKNKYYANSKGMLQVGFQTIDENKYFFSRDKKRYGVMRTGTFMIGYNQYTFNSEGIFQKVQYIPSYYNQKDKRWNNKKYGVSTFGKTGCAPTSMAMAFQSLLEKLILPTTVADYLYYNTKEYNKYAAGSSGLAIIKASNYFKIQATPLLSLDEVKIALENGKIVFAAMGEGKFATKYYNHAILLYDYSKGNTRAVDPLYAKNNGWVSLQQVYKEQSKDPDDSRGGSNFYVLSTK